MLDKTFIQLMEDAHAIRMGDYELSPSHSFEREVHYSGKRIGTVYRVNVAHDVKDVPVFQYLSLYRHNNAFLRHVGTFETYEDAFYAMKMVHEKVTK